MVDYVIFAFAKVKIKVNVQSRWKFYLQCTFKNGCDTWKQIENPPSSFVCSDDKLMSNCWKNNITEKIQKQYRPR